MTAKIALRHRVRMAADVLRGRSNATGHTTSPRHRRPARKALAVLVPAIVAATAGGVAYAYWNTTGSGSGSAHATTAVALTTSTATPTAQLYPGATGDAKVTINNPNPFGVTVTDIVGSTITSSGGIGTCSTTGVTFADQHSLADAVGANSSATFTLTGAVSMTNASDTGCQGATFTIPVALTAHS
jgi:hypothetical protein